MTHLPSYLLPILQRRVRGQTNNAIADELGLSPSTVETYAKRIIQFFKEEGLWDTNISSKTGLMLCGRQYLAALASPSSIDEFDSRTMFC